LLREVIGGFIEALGADAAPFKGVGGEVRDGVAKVAFARGGRRFRGGFGMGWANSDGQGRGQKEPLHRAEFAHAHALRLWGEESEVDVVEVATVPPTGRYS